MNEIIANISQVLMYIIPGYVTLRIREEYGLKRQHKEYGRVLSCVLYSFLIQLIYEFITQICRKAVLLEQLIVTINTNETFRVFIYIVISIILGIFLIHFPNTCFCKWIVKKFLNKNVTPTPSVWIDAMVAPNGAWAIVYLSNGLIYRGQLLKYSSDLDIDKDILLYNYSLLKAKHGEFQVVYDFSTQNKYRVYLSYRDIVSIEIQEE